jgi:hypothetical protein
MIAHCRGNIVDSVLAAPWTIQTNLITSSFIYCLWPNIMYQQDALRTDLPIVRGVRRPINSWPVHFTNGYWKTACGKYCPAVDRLSTNDDVTASFAWNANAAPEVQGNTRLDDVWNGKVYVYRFMKRCRNASCKNYSSNRDLRVM